MVISPKALSQEIAEVEQAGVKVNMCISDRATLCLPLHAQEDTLEEQRLGDQAYGSTRQGIAPAYGDRVMKKGILVGWLQQPDVLVERLKFWMDWKLPQLRALYPSFEFEQTADEMASWLLEVSAPWRDAICNVTLPLKNDKQKTKLYYSKHNSVLAVIWYTASTHGPPLQTLCLCTQASVVVFLRCVQNVLLP